MNRRGFIQSGAVFGITLPALLANQEGVAKAKSLIHVYLPGGMATQEAWDPKPFSPLEYRGPFSAIDTNVTGLRFSETMKDMAKVADKITVIHSMTHGEAAHDRGTQNMFTGYKPSPALKYPSFGAVVSHELGARKDMPPYICIPKLPNPHANAGYLSPAYGPFGLGSDPASANFKVRDIALPDGISEERFLKRRSLLDIVDSGFNGAESSKQLEAMNSFYQDAYGMISSPEARAAFDINREGDNTKRKYGENSAGMRMLMARRLIESGVRLVTLTYGGWDHHNNILKSFKKNIEVFDTPSYFKDIDKYHRIIHETDLANNFQVYYKKSKNKLSKEMQTAISRGMKYSAKEYLDAVDFMERSYESYKEVFEDYHGVLSPCSTGVADKGLKSTGSADFNRVWSYMHTPAISLPLLQGENNLPLGVQLIGDKYDDHRFLGVANWLEKESKKFNE